MSSILDLNSASSDSEDDGDYIPPKDIPSDESLDEISEDESEITETPKKKKAKLDIVESVTKPDVDKKNDDEIWQNFMKAVDSRTPYGKLSGKENESTTSETNLPIENKVNLIQSSNQQKMENSETKSERKGTKEENTFSENEETNKSNENIVTKDVVLEDKKEINETKKLTGEKLNMCTSRTGLTSILGTLANKGKKETVLQKSLNDWKKFKESEGIEKDLETFNKGRLGFIERQRFLERSDLRSFETEKNARLTKKKNNPK